MRISDWSSDVCSSDLIETIDGKADAFEAQGSTVTIAARAVLIATGVENRSPALDADTHRDALQRGMLRYCPVCDGYEASGQSIGVIGANTHGVAEALFLRPFSARLTLVAQEAIDLGPAGIGRAHVCTPATTAQRVCRLL